MSAPNFYAKSGKYFAIEVESEDGYEIDDAIENVTSELEAATKNSARYFTEELDHHDNDRNYPGRAFLKLGMKNEREDLQAAAVLIIRSGYYTGANIDIDLHVLDNYTGDEIEIDDLTVDDVIEAVHNYTDKRPTRAAAEATHRRLLRDAAALEALAIKTLKEYTTPLIKVGQFSNGEAVYERQLLRG